MASRTAKGQKGYKLETSLPYLLNRAGIRLGRLFENETHRFGLTVPMYRVLALLIEREESGLLQLSAGASIDASTLSRMIGTLAKQGLVVRTRRDGNQREVSIRLTEKGKEVTLQLIPKAQHFEEILAQKIGAVAHTQLCEQLIQIYHNLDALQEEQKKQGM